MRTLERDGLVQRQPVDTIPPGVMYELTETGRELAELIESIMVWTRKHIAHIRASQQRMDGLEKVANGGQADQSSQA
jgi:DNA-binding HxlR family transcriptional regulator